MDGDEAVRDWRRVPSAGDSLLPRWRRRVSRRSAPVSAGCPFDRGRTCPRRRARRSRACPVTRCRRRWGTTRRRSVATSSTTSRAAPVARIKGRWVTTRLREPISHKHHDHEHDGGLRAKRGRSDLRRESAPQFHHRAFGDLVELLVLGERRRETYDVGVELRASSIRPRSVRRE